MNHTGTTAKILTGFILLGVALAGGGLLASHFLGGGLGGGLVAYHLLAGLAGGLLPFLVLKSSLLEAFHQAVEGRSGFLGRQASAHRRAEAWRPRKPLRPSTA